MSVTLYLRSESSVLNQAESLQKSLYKHPQKKSLQSNIYEAIFLPICEIAIELIAKPLASIEALRKAVMNRFFQKSSTADVLFHAEKSIVHLVDTPLSIATTPFQLVHQVFVTTFYPSTASSLSEVPGFIKTTSFTRSLFNEVQEIFYEEIQKQISNTNPLLARGICSIVGTLDVAIDTLIPVIETMENLFYAVKHLIETFACKPRRSLKGVLYFISQTRMGVANSISALCMSPIKLIYQISSAIYNPYKVQSIASPTEAKELEIFWDSVETLETQEQIQKFLLKIPCHILQKSLDTGSLSSKKLLSSISAEQIQELSLWSISRKDLNAMFPYPPLQGPLQQDIKRICSLSQEDKKILTKNISDKRWLPHIANQNIVSTSAFLPPKKHRSSSEDISSKKCSVPTKTAIAFSS
jgi:hypothetical protein